MTIFFAITGGLLLLTLATMATAVATGELSPLFFPIMLPLTALVAALTMLAFCAVVILVLACAVLSVPFAIARGVSTVAALAIAGSRTESIRTRRNRLSEPLPLALVMLPYKEALGYRLEWRCELAELCIEGRYADARAERRRQLRGAVRLAVMLRVKSIFGGPSRAA